METPRMQSIAAQMRRMAAKAAIAEYPVKKINLSLTFDHFEKIVTWHGENDAV